MPSVGRSQHYKNSTAETKRSRFRSATERAAHRLRGGFAGRRIEGSFRAGSLNISKRFRIAHVTGQENKVRWYRETFALLHTYAEGRFFDPRTTKKLKETHQWQRNWQRPMIPKALSPDSTRNGWTRNTSRLT